MPKFGTFKFGMEKFGSYPVQVERRVGKWAMGAGGYTSRPLIVNGVVTRGKDMLPNASLIKAVEGVISNYELKLFIQDANNNWVDFTDRTNISGRNQLKKIGSLSYSGERFRGEVRQQLSGLSLDSSDGFWSRPFPPTLYASFDENWQWLGDRVVAAAFDLSVNGRRSALYRHRVALKAYYTTTASRVRHDVTLGVFLIDAVVTNQSSHSADITLTSLAFPLTEQDADGVKEGVDWYINRGVSSLVKWLVMETYRDADGAIPAEFDIDEIPYYPVPNIDSNGWAISHLGRPPEQTYTRSGAGFTDSPTWNAREPNRCRAMGAHELTLGTLSVTAGLATVTASASLATLDYPLMAGDVLVIPRQEVAGDGGSAEHFGYYEVESYVAATGVITLTEPVRGSEDESGLAWCIHRIYMGVGCKLYQYNQHRDAYYELTSPAEALPSGYTIRRLFFNPNDTTYPIWGVALSNLDIGEIGYTMQIFRFRWNGSTPEVDLWGSPISNVMFGEYIQGGLAYADSVGLSGNFDDDNWYGFSADERAHIPILFDQHITSAQDVELLENFRATSIDDVYDGNETAYDYPGSRGSWSRAGFYAQQWEKDGATLSNAFRFSMGQDGFLVFQPNWGTQGSLIYAKHVIDESEYEMDSAGRYGFNFYYADLADSSPIEELVPMGTTWNNGSIRAQGTPVCGCANPDGSDLWFATVVESNDEYAATDGFYYYGRVWRKETLGGDAALYEDCVDSAASANLPGHAVLELAYVNSMIMAIAVDFQSMYTDGIRYKVVAAQLSGSPDYHPTWGQCFFPITTFVPYRLWGLTPMLAYDSATETFKEWCYYIETESQRLRRVYIEDDQLSATREIVERTGFLPGEADGYSNILASNHTRELMWISSRLPNATLPELAQGRFYLTRWSYLVPARVELADFTDMDTWTAIGHLAEKVDALYGFHPDGNFFFKRKPTHVGAEYTFTNTGENRLCDITTDDGYAEIVNSAQRSPSVPIIAPSELTWNLGADSKYGEDGYMHQVDIAQDHLCSRFIRLVCVGGGRPATGLDENGVPENPEARFSFETLEASATATLAANYAHGGSYVTLDDQFFASYDSTLTVQGDNQEQVANGDVSIDSLSGSAKMGAILRQDNLEIMLSAAIDADTARLPLSLSTGAAVNLANPIQGMDSVLAPGSMIVVGDLASGTNMEYMEIVEVGGDYLIALRSLEEPGGTNVAHAAGERVAIMRLQNVYFLRYGDDLDENCPTGYTGVSFVVGAEVVIDVPLVGASSGTTGSGVDDATQHEAAIFIPVDGHYMEIGGSGTTYSTGIKVCFAFSGSRSVEPKFHAGDIIKIRSPGLQLSHDTGLSHTFTDMASVKKYGKRDSRLGKDNPFLSDDEAYWSVRREVQDNRYPRAIYRITCVSVPWILPSIVVDVQSKEMLPTFPQFKDGCYVTTVAHNPQTSGLMQVTCKAIKPY